MCYIERHNISLHIENVNNSLNNGERQQQHLNTPKHVTYIPGVNNSTFL